jgi:hypothetical protein
MLSLVTRASIGDATSGCFFTGLRMANFQCNASWLRGPVKTGPHDLLSINNCNLVNSWLGWFRRFARIPYAPLFVGSPLPTLKLGRPGYCRSGYQL